MTTETYQPDLFAVQTDTPTAKPSVTLTPTDRATHKPSLSATNTHTPTTSPYVPSLIPYAQWLAIFCGDKTLAYWYYSHQPEVQATD